MEQNDDIWHAVLKLNHILITQFSNKTRNNVRHAITRIPSYDVWPPKALYERLLIMKIERRQLSPRQKQTNQVPGKKDSRHRSEQHNKPGLNKISQLLWQLAFSSLLLFVYIFRHIIYNCNVMWETCHFWFWWDFLAIFNLQYKQNTKM